MPNSPPPPSAFPTSPSPDSSPPTSDPSHLSRRKFVEKLCTGIGCGGLAAAFGTSVIANVRYFFPKVLYEPSPTFKVGFAEDFREGEINTRFKKDQRVWIRRTSAGLEAYLAVCTHLGCTPNWMKEQEVFRCPCHGSIFSEEGDPIAGPAPEPLYRLALSVADDGQIIVNKSKRENRPGRRERPPFLLRA